MERRFELRKDALLAEAQVPAGLYQGTLERLERFVEPFAACLTRMELAIGKDRMLPDSGSERGDASM